MAKRKSKSKPEATSPLNIIGVIVVLIIMALSYFFGVDLLGIGDDPEPGSEPVVVSTSGDWYEIYFTDPTCPPEAERTRG
jgi:hypothetical protein